MSFSRAYVRMCFRKVILRIMSNKCSLNNVNWQFVSISAILRSRDREKDIMLFDAIAAGYNLSHCVGRTGYKSPTSAHARHNLVGDFQHIRLARIRRKFVS